MSVDKDVDMFLMSWALERYLDFDLGIGESGKWHANRDVTITEVSYHNKSAGTALTSAATVTNNGDAASSSSADLAADTSEADTTITNAAVTDGNYIKATAGDQPMHITVTVKVTMG